MEGVIEQTAPAPIESHEERIESQRAVDVYPGRQLVESHEERIESAFFALGWWACLPRPNLMRRELKVIIKELKGLGKVFVCRLNLMRRELKVRERPRLRPQPTSARIS